jgi:hypothetical protein
LDSLGVCLQPLIGVHYHLSIPFLHSSIFFIHPIRKLASLSPFTFVLSPFPWLLRIW